MRRRGGDPLVEASIFSHRAYTAGLSMIVVFFAGMLGTMLVLTLFLQFGEHFSAIHAGITLAPFAAGTAIGAVLAGAVLVPRLGRTTLQIAAVIAAAGVLWLRQVILAHGLRHELARADRAAAGGRDRHRDDRLAAVRLHPRVRHRRRGRIRLGRPQRECSSSRARSGSPASARSSSRTLAHDGFVTAISRCLLVELATMPVLLLLSFTLPSRAPDRDAAEAIGEPEPHSGGRVAAVDRALVGAGETR